MKNLFTKKQKTIFYNRRNTRGFTIVETLVACTIFVFSIVAMISVSARGVTENGLVRNRLTATYLAQEGIELVRNKRDTALLQDPVSGWANFGIQVTSGSCTIAAGGCDLDAKDYINNPFIACSIGGTPCVIQQDSVSGYYGHGSTNGVNTVFKRVITIDDGGGGSGDEVKVVVTVTWLQGVAPQSIVLTENVYNWK